MRASLAALALALARRHAPRYQRHFDGSKPAAAWAACSSSAERARQGAASDRNRPSLLSTLPCSASAFSTSSRSSPLDAALAEAWSAAAAASLAGSDDDESGDESGDEELDRAISILEAELLAGGREGEGGEGAAAAAARSPLSAAAAFEAVALFRLWRSSSSHSSSKSSSGRRAGSGGDDDARSLALAERAAARAVSIAGAAPGEAAPLLARLCALRHAAALAALGRGAEAATALEAFEERRDPSSLSSSPSSSSSSSFSSSSPEVITSLHLAEARFYRELVSPRCSNSSSRSLAAALSALDGGGGGRNPFARRVRASALAALRGSLESLLARGKLPEARRLAEAEAESHESRARAEGADGEEEEERRTREETETTAAATNSASAPLPRRSSRPGGSLLPPRNPSAEAAAHARYRLATLAYSNGDRDSLSLARAALEASVALWGRQDDRSWLRRHRVAAAALAGEVLFGLSDTSPSSSSSSSSASSRSVASASSFSSLPGNDGDESRGGEEPAAAASSSSPPATPAPPPLPPPPSLSPSEIEAEADGALRRFRERLGGESGLAGEARLVSAAARLLRLRAEREQRRREGAVSSAAAPAAAAPSSPPSSPLAAFEAVLSPKREADAAAEVERGFREMVRGCSGGAEHPLVKRASEIKKALLLLPE